MMLLLLQLKVCAAAVNAHTLRTPNHGGLYRSGRRCDRHQESQFRRGPPALNFVGLDETSRNFKFKFNIRLLSLVEHQHSADLFAHASWQL